MALNDSDNSRLTGSDLIDTEPHVSPNLIQRLYSDILAQVFTFCLPDVHKDSWRVERISSRKAPLLLCSVCSYWRSLAISMPRLWQILHFGTSEFEELPLDAELITTGIRTWLDRSRSLPLSIRVVFWTVGPESIKAASRLIFEVLLQEVSRWESFELHDDGSWITPPHFGALQGLHTLDISGSSIDGIPFTAAPRLKKLGLRSPCPNFTSVFAIPWDQLVDLTIGDAQTISMAVELIKRCPKLESLWLRVDEDGDEDDDEQGSLNFKITKHDALRRLHLDMQPYVTAVTNRLILPALTDLSLWARCIMFEVEVKVHCSQLVDFFTRSNCKLRIFELYHSEFGPGELLNCLCQMSCQTLTHLVVQGETSTPPIVDRELLLRLTYPDDDNDVPICPKLSYLELNKCYCSDESFPDLLGRMVQSRCFRRTQDTRLLSLRLINDYTISKEDHELLKLAQKYANLELNYSFIG